MGKNKYPMPALDPLTREQLALWVLGTVEKYVRQAERLEQRLKEESLGKYEIGQLQYYRWTAGYAQWLAHLIRNFPLKELDRS
jgi:NAD(P)H-nitrite reductase large subunit